MSTTFSSSSAVEKLRKLLLLLLLANALFCLLFLLTSFSFFDSTDTDELSSSSEEEEDQWTSSPVHLPLAADYLRVLLSHSGRLFLLEPFYLVAQLNSPKSLSFLKQRFSGFPADWPPAPPPSPNASAPQHLSVGLFADHFEDFEEDLLDQSSQLLHNFQPFSEATSPAAAADRLTSVTYRNAERSLYLHLVLFYRSEGHYWARFARSWKDEKAEKELHQPQPPTIFDPFHLLHINGIAFPADIEHYLSQLPTARYLECTGESRQWMAEKGVSSVSKTEAVFRRSLTGMKALARHLRMEVWIASGTLLGWYRQCSVTPYTTDTDFASWSAYIAGESLQSTSDLFKKETALAGTHLRLLQRFGTPSTRSLEYSFSTVKDGEKVDLFFVYRNRTSASGEQLEEFLSPLHDVQKGRFIFQRYPSYSLCSVLLLGLKVLAPCTPREVIIAGKKVTALFSL